MSNQHLRASSWKQVRHFISRFSQSVNRANSVNMNVPPRCPSRIVFGTDYEANNFLHAIWYISHRPHLRRSCYVTHESNLPYFQPDSEFKFTVLRYKNKNEMLRSLGAEHCKTVEHGRARAHSWVLLNKNARLGLALLLCLIAWYVWERIGSKSAGTSALNSHHAPECHSGGRCFELGVYPDEFMGFLTYK